MKTTVIGFPGSGKSTVTRALGQKYGKIRYRDLTILTVCSICPAGRCARWKKSKLWCGASLTNRKQQDGESTTTIQYFIGGERMRKGDLILLMNFGRVPCVLRGAFGTTVGARG